MKTRKISFEGRPVGDLDCLCPSCGTKTPPRLVGCGDSLKHCATKCPECGLNTGTKKSPRLALNAWNAMAPRLTPAHRLNATERNER